VERVRKKEEGRRRGMLSLSLRCEEKWRNCGGF